MPYGFNVTDRYTDQSPRVAASTTVVASPAAASETVICQITGLDGQLSAQSGVLLVGTAAFTVGTSGTAVRLRIRTGTTAGAGTTIFDSGACTGGVAAGNLLCLMVQGWDTASTGGTAIGSTSYCLTLTVTAGAATSTVSATNLSLNIV